MMFAFCATIKGDSESHFVQHTHGLYNTVSPTMLCVSTVLFVHV